MPELPEVETVRSQLSEVVVNKKIINAIGRVPKIIGFDTNFSAKLKDVTITGIDRVGKLLIFKTDNTNINILVHLKMTGQLLFAPAAARSAAAGGGHTLTKQDIDLPNKHTHASLQFSDRSWLHFNDMRKFGYMKIATQQQLDVEKLKYGPEPIDPDYTFKEFNKIFTKRTISIKGLLLNQKLVSGLGNIYVDEACWMAGVRPARSAGLTTKVERQALFKSARQVLLDSIKAGGTTFYSFAHTDGGAGTYFEQMKVFGRQGKPCYRCGGEIKKIKLAGRGTHFCAQCQK